MNRILIIQEKIEKEGLDALLITSVSNVTYLSGFKGDSSYLLITRNECYLLTDGRYTEQAQKECSDQVTILKWLEDERYSARTYNYLIEKHQLASFGFESQHLSFSEYDQMHKKLAGVGLHPTSSWVEDIRQIKDEEEIKCLSKACQISDKALELTVPFIKPGITELELTAQLEYNLKTNGADDLSFKSIVLTGSRTSLLHGIPGNAVIQKGDIVLFDFGAEYNSYHADISRVFAVGKPQNELLELYQIVFNIQQIAVESIHEGVKGEEIDKTIRKNIPGKYLPFFYPGIGHGVGLDIHELPFIKEKAAFSFQSGMVLTVEPGIYIPNLGGIRIEDTILVQKQSSLSLTGFNRELIIF